MPRLAGWSLCLGAAWWLCSCLWTPAAWAAEPEAPYNLQELTELALRHNLEAGEGKWKIAEAQAKVRQVEAMRLLPRLRLERSEERRVGKECVST